MARRAVTIVVHTDGKTDSRSVRVPLWLAKALVVSGAVLATLIVAAAALYAPVVRTAARVPAMQAEIERLTEENRQVLQLAGTLAELEEVYDQVRTMLGADVVPERARPGGGIPVGYPIVARLAPSALEPATPLVPFRWPLEVQGIVTRGHDDADEGEAHSGLDIAVPMGTPIRASGSGTVVGAGEDPEYGLFVRVAHAEGYATMYGHASRLLVSQGDSVRVGEVVALSGSTGRSTAPHLHFEILRGGRSVDPRTLLKER